jgi:hypothetical protein
MDIVTLQSSMYKIGMFLFGNIQALPANGDGVSQKALNKLTVAN